MAGICPRPDKRWFKTKSAAKLALRRSSLHGRDTLQAYRCACGGFHLGHKQSHRHAPRVAA